MDQVENRETQILVFLFYFKQYFNIFMPHTNVTWNRFQRVSIQFLDNFWNDINK